MWEHPRSSERPFHATSTNQPTVQSPTEGGDLRFRASRPPSVCLTIHALTASLGLETDTLNCNWYCAYAEDSRLG